MSQFSSTLGKSLKEKNFPDTSVLYSKKKNNTTWAWKSIHGEVAFVHKYSFWLLGDGKKNLTWKDNWIIGEQEPPSTIAEFDLEVSYSTVSDLIDINTHTWKTIVLQQLLSPSDVLKIMRMKIPHHSQDGLI